MTEKEVYFDQYCKICKHLDKNAEEDPCWDCLNRGWNYDSHKPQFFEEDEQRAKVNQNIEGANKT